MTDPRREGIDALVLKTAEHAERIGRIDDAEQRHYKEVADRLTQMAKTLSGIKGTVEGQGDILCPLAGLDERVDALAKIVEALTPKEDAPAETYVYEPRPNRDWYKMSEEDKATAIGQLKLWVSDIFVPGYGHLADMLPSCWAIHNFCLYHLDALCEMWCCLWLTEERSFGSIAGQEDYMIRYLPAACEQMRTEGSKCEHQT